MKLPFVCLLLLFTPLTLVSQCLPTSSSASVSTCNSIISPGGNLITQSGTYFDTLINSNGCDSVITTIATVNYDNSILFDVVVCDSGASWCDCGGQPNLYPPGSYTFIEQTVAGCDSTIYLNITSYPSTFAVIDTTVCDFFVSEAGFIYNSNGSYVESFLSMGGCDSIRTYNVTIVDFDSSIVQISNNMLKATEIGASYQWIDCNSNQPIPGETNQTFTASVIGDYACIITVGLCSEMSECIRIDDAIGLGITDNSSNKDFKLYPNPSTGQFTVEIIDFSDQTLIQVVNVVGEIVYFSYATTSSPTIDLGSIARGIYIIKIQNTNSTIEKTILIN